MRRSILRHSLAAMFLLALSACALFPPTDPLNINVVGIDPLPSQDLEMRLAVKIRVQNPNDRAITYNGVSLNLDVNGRPLASGVSDESGTLQRFSEVVLSVPVSVTAFSVLRQTFVLGQGQSLDNVPYELHGKLANGLLGTVLFSDHGNLSLAPLAPLQEPANPYHNTRQ
ncbi:MAG: LEA type 2 family protein [Pseudomonas sp.]|nr:LEA type 2 family protein [Pseudomonas sp.]